MEILDVVKEIIEPRLDNQEINEQTILSTLGLDSLDLVEISLEFEDRFGIEFTSDEITKLVTIKDVIAIIDKKRK